MSGVEGGVVNGEGVDAARPFWVCFLATVDAEGSHIVADEVEDGEIG